MSVSRGEHEDEDEDFQSEAKSSPLFNAGACSARGARPSNEDQHILTCDWCSVPGGSPVGLFAVFDGHGGPAVAILASMLLRKILRTELQAPADDGELSWHSAEGRRKAVLKAFMEVDDRLSRKGVSEQAGSTCVAAVVWRAEGNDGCFHVLFANLGDSRGLVVHRDGRLIGETVDHKPELPAERERIVKAGGVVSKSVYGFPARVDGDLSLSRAFGDFRLKTDKTLPPEEQKVSCVPEVCEFQANVGDAVILACDGAFDVLSSNEVATTALAELDVAGEGDTNGSGEVAMGDRRLVGARQAARSVVQTALKRRSMDNVTCVVARLVGGDAAPCAVTTATETKTVKSEFSDTTEEAGGVTTAEFQAPLKDAGV